MLRRLLTAALLLLAACAHAPEPTPAAPACPYASANDGTQSYEVLCRDPLAVHVKVKHVLIGWKDLASDKQPIDPRAAQRSYPEAQQLARELLQKLQAGAPIEPLMAEYSEDPGSAKSGIFYEASPDASLVMEFKALAVRLHPGEAGIVKSVFGLHVMQRVP